jgi:hypothetical protein
MELQQRINMTAQGQVTWANPEIGKKCIECANIADAPRPSQRKKHICELVRVVSGKKGVPYDATIAVACSKFQDIDNSKAEE